MNAPTSTARSAQQSDWLDHAIRVGLVAYGIVHLLVGWLALQLAFGDKSESASNAGALQTLAEQPYGEVLIWLIAVGMGFLVVWRLLEFGFGYRDEQDDTKRWRKRADVARQGDHLRRPRRQRREGRARRRIRRRHRLHDRQADGPARGSAHRRGDRRSRSSATASRWSSAAGPRSSPSTSTPRARPARTARRTSCSARWATSPRASPSPWSAACSCYAAVTHEAKKSGGLDQALQTVLGYPFGQVLLVAIGLGIAAYGLFCFARARHLSR